MLYFGSNITQPADPLQPVSIENLYHALRNPKPVIRQLVDQLRIIQTLDRNGYRMQKKALPYIVCACFKPAIRRRENFLNIVYFIVDIDHIGAHFNKQLLWEKLSADPTLLLMFSSPGGDGLKLLFRLAQKCSDYGLFSAFYKLFVHQFAAKYHLQNVIDMGTSDVTRACFISYDENAWYNADAEAVDMDPYIQPYEADDLWKAATEAGSDLIRLKDEAQPEMPAGKKDGSPVADVIASIRQKLNPNAYGKPRQKQYHVPPEIEEYMIKLTKNLSYYQLHLLETSPISYGRKLKIGAAGAWAEVNLFYGKKGFTFVKTTKTGSNPELATLCVQILEKHLYEEPNS